MRNGNVIWRLGYVANMQTQIFKAFLGAAKVCGTQCWRARSSEGRQNSSLKMRKGEVYAAAGPPIGEDGGNES